MTRTMGGLDNSVVCNLINIHTQRHATSNQQPQPQDRTPQRDHRIIWRTRAQGREARDRIGEGRKEAKKRKIPRRVIDAMWKTGDTWAEGENSVDKKASEVLVQHR